MINPFALLTRFGRFLLVWLLLMTALPTSVMAETLVFRHVNVIPMTSETVMPLQTVVVEGQKITSVSDDGAITIPVDATIIDGTGKYLMPGLSEMHSHIPTPASDYFRWTMDLFMANGVTTVRGMIGRPGHPEVRDAINRGEVFAPRLLVASPSLNGNTVVSPEDGVRQVREYKADGFDFLKMHPGLTMDEFLAISKASKELDIPLTGHIPPLVGLKAALDNNIHTVEHLDGYIAYLAWGPKLVADTPMAGKKTGEFNVKFTQFADDHRMDEIVAMTVKAGTWNCPTENLAEFLVGADESAEEMAKWPSLAYLAPKQREAWLAETARAQSHTPPELAKKFAHLRRELLVKLHAAGAGLLLGSDAPQIMHVPGFSLHREIKLMVKAGLTPYEALQMGTSNVATFTGFNMGYVVAGRDADLILLDGNPLKDINNVDRIEGVMVRGKWLDRGALDALLAKHLDGK